MALYRQIKADEKLSKIGAEIKGTEQELPKNAADRYQQAIDNTVDLFKSWKSQK